MDKINYLVLLSNGWDPELSQNNCLQTFNGFEDKVLALHELLDNVLVSGSTTDNV